MCSEEGSWAEAGEAWSWGRTYPGVHGQAHLDDCSPGLRGFRLRRRLVKGKTNEGSGVGQVPIVAVGDAK